VRLIDILRAIALFAEWSRALKLKDVMEAEAVEALVLGVGADEGVYVLVDAHPLRWLSAVGRRLERRGLRVGGSDRTLAVSNKIFETVESLLDLTGVLRAVHYIYCLFDLDDL